MHKKYLTKNNKRRIVVGITGATGSIYAIRMLEILKLIPKIEIHLIISKPGILNIFYELNIDKKNIYNLSDFNHNINDISSLLASGSFKTIGMIIIPCSTRTLSAIANGMSDNLITRSAEVTLKERRPLLIIVREAPFNLSHLRNMLILTKMNSIIFPPLISFYNYSNSIEQMINENIYRFLNIMNIYF